MTVTRELLHPLVGFAWSPDRVSAELVASAYGYQFAVRPMLFRFSTYSARRPRIEPPAKPASPHFEPAVLFRRKRLNTQPGWPDPLAYHKAPAEGIPFTAGHDRPDVPRLTSARHPGMIGQWSPRSS